MVYGGVLKGNSVVEVGHLTHFEEGRAGSYLEWALPILSLSSSSM